MREKGKIKLIFCLLAAIFFISTCRDNSQYISKEPPEAPVQTAPIEKVDPAPPEPSPEESQPDEDPQTVAYILNTNTKKFHKPSCRSAKQIKPGNRQETGDAREDLLARGYSSCGNCKPQHEKDFTGYFRRPPCNFRKSLVSFCSGNAFNFLQGRIS